MSGRKWVVVFDSDPLMFRDTLLTVVWLANQARRQLRVTTRGGKDFRLTVEMRVPVPKAIAKLEAP